MYKNPKNQQPPAKANGTEPLLYLRNVKKDEDVVSKRRSLIEEFTEAFGESAALEIEQQIRGIVEDAVRMVTSSRAVFREVQITNAAIRIAQKPNEINKAVLSHDKFKQLVEHTVLERPFVVIGTTGTLTTKEMLEYEKEVVRLAGIESGQHVLDDDVVKKAISIKEGITEEQIAAVMVATESGRDVSVIEGAAGAGKSFTMEAICKAYGESGYDVKGTAISWVAAKVLGSSAKIGDSRALTGLLMEMDKKFKRGAEYFHRPTLVVVDESGMVGTKQMAQLLFYCNASSYPVKVVLTGDTLQVKPVAAGAAMETIVAYYGTTRIDKIRRQALASHRGNVYNLSRRKSGPALYNFVQQECVKWASNKEDQIDILVKDYISYRVAHPDRSALVLAYENKTVAEANERIRKAYKSLGLIHGNDVTIRVTDTKNTFELPFSVGDEVVLRANNPSVPVYKIIPDADPLNENEWGDPERTGVFNRNAGRIVGIKKGVDTIGSYDIVIDLDGDIPGRVIVNSESFQKSNNDRVSSLPMVYNYATTIYSSQGQTVDRVFFIDGKLMDFRTAYVGLSRHRDNVSIYLDETDLHLRLDALQHKKKTRSSISNKDYEKGVILGRYTRSEMLREVAITWAKDSQNPTALLYEKTKRLRVYGTKKGLEERAEIKPDKESQAGNIWDMDLLATLLEAPAAAKDTASSWEKGRLLDRRSVLSATTNLCDQAKWLDDQASIDLTGRLLSSISEQMPAAGLWGGEEVLPLAKSMRDAVEAVELAVEKMPCASHQAVPPNISQIVMQRVAKGDSLSRSMSKTASIITEDYSEVDVSALLELDAPLEEAHQLSKSDVDSIRAATSVEVIPVSGDDESLSHVASRDNQENTSASSPQAEGGGHASVPAGDDSEEGGVLKKLVSYIQWKPSTKKQATKEGDPDEQDVMGSSPFPKKLSDDFVSPFIPQEATLEEASSPEVVKAGKMDAMRAAMSWILSKPSPSADVPFIRDRSPISAITPEGVIDFAGVPQAAQAQNRAPGERSGPSESFIKAAYGSMWGRGKGNRPRIVARDGSGRIMARYALDGACVSGNAYPPMILNKAADKTTPIYIVAGSREMFWLLEHKLRSVDKDKDQPHIIWDAKDCDLGLIAKDMGGISKIVIARSKYDDAQAGWAKNTKELLLKRWRVRSVILPPLGYNKERAKEEGVRGGNDAVNVIHKENGKNVSGPQRRRRESPTSRP